VKIRINDLARELEVKSKAVLDLLPVVGIAEKKTHSGSISVEEAEKVRQHFRSRDHEKAPRPQRPLPDKLKTKIDLSHVSRPGDVLRAVLRAKQTLPARSRQSELPTELPEAWRPVPGQPIYRRRASTVPKVEPSSAAARTHTAQIPSPRVLMPRTGPRPLYATHTTQTPVKLVATDGANREEEAARQKAIDQAEEALKVLREQEKKQRKTLSAE